MAEAVTTISSETACEVWANAENEEKTRKNARIDFMTLPSEAVHGI
jgi:hypothetical protein